MAYVVVALLALAAFFLDRPLLKDKRLSIAYGIFMTLAIGASYVVMFNRDLVGLPQLVSNMMDPLAKAFYDLKE
ncbi:hypothetical protein ACFQZE_19895 [Paenibacillus sp. GCM10027627]|uniref:hypothetical protein n=1 Tax=unclassified Paenibacillus TaxID=185978 RepID=UPI00362D8CA5